jgi:ribokinase
MAKIIVAGSINMDVVARAERHPVPGETVFGRELRYIPGGKGSNQAVAASRLGGDVSLVGKLGRDPFGNTLYDFLQSEKLNLTYLQRSETAPSGIALIVVDARSENTIVVIAGSNGEVDADSVAPLTFDGSEIVLSQFEIPQPAIKALFEKAHASGALTVLNPAPAAPFVDGLLALIDVLVVNETELAFLSGSGHVPNTPDEIIGLARSLRVRESQRILVTLGAQGALCLDGDTVHRVEGQKVQAVDTTGAGDCFVGGLAVALADGHTLAKAMRFANAAASISVTRLGASASLPHRHEVEVLLR